jgi:hypothetical protein
VAEPSADVTITITPDGTTALDVTTLTFTAGNFSAKQPVKVTPALHAAASPLSFTSQLTHTAASSDPKYDN